MKTAKKQPKRGQKTAMWTTLMTERVFVTTCLITVSGIRISLADLHWLIFIMLSMPVIPICWFMHLFSSSLFDCTCVHSWQHQQIRQNLTGFFQAGRNMCGLLHIMRPYEAAPEWWATYTALWGNPRNDRPLLRPNEATPETVGHIRPVTISWQVHKRISC
jgi:hypothetical protein